MKRRFLLVFAALLLALSCRPALAWNSIGHMSVAWVAWQKLSPTEKARVGSLLRLNPNYQKWLSYIPAGAPDTDRDMYVFMMAATWPDEIKAMRTIYQGNDTPPRQELSSLNTGYDDHQFHKYWHFINTPLGGDPANLAPLSVPNVTQKITAFRTALASKIPDPVKSYDLVWLIHLVGDVHQPLHCVTRVSADHPKGDLGGNLVLVSGSAKELHGFWDGALGEGETKNFMTAVKVATALPDADTSLVSDDKEDDWAAESYKLAASAVYIEPVGAGLGPFTINAVYTANAQQIAKQRVALAGARLANLLKEALECTGQGCAN
jgi:S1/P1 Nuclease